MSGHRPPKPGAVLYPFAALVAAMGGSERSVARALGISGQTEVHYRTFGMSEKVADRLAVRAGLHPFVVWPAMADAAIAEAWRVCAAEGCPGRFLPKRENHRFCSPTCQAREGKRRQRLRPEVRERDVEKCRRYYAEAGDYVRAEFRRKYWANPERERARKRAERRRAA